MGWAEVIGHERPIRLLRAGLRTGRVAEAYLFSGQEGIGKRLVGRLFAKALLCSNREPCGHCSGCRKVEAGTHPDLLHLSPTASEGQSIKIEQVRNLQSALVYRPIEGPRRVILIEPADRLVPAGVPAAANALLKTLEESPTACTFILITSRPDLLPFTVRSRCQGIVFSPLPLRLIEQALIEQHGFSSQKARLAAALSGGSFGQALAVDPEVEEQVQQRLRQVILGQVDARALLELADEHGRDPASTEKVLRMVSLWLEEQLLSGRHLTPAAVFRLLDLVHEIEEGLRRNVNRPLALEVLFMEMSAAWAGRPPGSQ